MVLAITMAAAGLLAAFCFLQVITGHELIRLSRTRRPPAQVRREYVGPTLIGISGVLMGIDGLIWWAMGLGWIGLIVTVATGTRTRRRA
jgi:hypothetical protein